LIFRETFCFVIEDPNQTVGIRPATTDLLHYISGDSPPAHSL